MEDYAAVKVGFSMIDVCWQITNYVPRLKHAAADNGTLSLPKPYHFALGTLATITAICRESSYPQMTPLRHAFWLKVPPLGTVLLLLTYLGFILALEFANNDTPGGQHFAALGIRAGWLAIAQVPLLILLAGKNNLIGLATGVSYERLNVLHRWVARGLLLLATLHFGYQSYGWAQYGLMQLEWSTDTCPPTGIAAYAILLWLNLSTLAPLRNLSYEFFVVQHLLTFFGFIIAIMMHLPSTAYYTRVYIYIPIALYLIDRIVRTLRWTYNNARPARATLTSLDGEATRIRFRSRQVKKWSPGSFVLLSIPSFGIAQSHPATIVSTPSSHGGDMIFILKSHRGFTKRLLKSANPSFVSLPLGMEKDAQKPQKTHLAFVDGPYGGSHADFASFDSAVLICGSTGVTFIVPILLSIADRAAKQRLPLRFLDVVWVVKSSSCITWVTEELKAAFNRLSGAGIEIRIRVFVTCDDTLTDSKRQDKACGCQCDKSLGPCCCISSTDSDDEQNTGTASKGGAPEVKVAEKRGGQPEYVQIESGRPDIHTIIWAALDRAKGETGVAVCGPLGLKTSVRNNVAKISDQRAVHKGSGAQGVYLHVEGFCW